MSSEMNYAHASGIWESNKLSDFANLHYDYEFLDEGGRLHNISFGGVLEARGKIQAYIYLVNVEFFQSKHFRLLCSRFKDTSHRAHEQASWMFANVFKHFSVDVGGTEVGNIISLAEFAMTPRNFEGFEFTKENLILNNVPDGNNVVCIKCDSDFDMQKMLVYSVNKHAFAHLPGGTPDEKFKGRVQGWGYFSAHDHVALCNTLGGMLRAGDSGLVYYPIDLRQVIALFGLDSEKYQPKTPHHALLDAVAQYKLFKTIRKQILDHFGS